MRAGGCSGHRGGCKVAIPEGRVREGRGEVWEKGWYFVASEHIRGKVRGIGSIAKGAEPKAPTRAGERGDEPGTVSQGSVGDERLDQRARGTVEAVALVRQLRVKVSGGYGTLEVTKLGQDRLL